jgi:hypothetical protein
MKYLSPALVLMAALMLQTLRGSHRRADRAADQWHEDMGIETPAAMDRMRAAVDELAMVEGRILRCISTEDRGFEPRARLEPGARGQDLDLDRYDLAG